MAIIYISHRMHEIAELADDCTVFRNGRYVETFAAGTKSDDAIVELMIGREYSSVFPPRAGQQLLTPRRCSRFATCPGTAGSRASTSRCGPAKSWAWAASTGRARSSSCWRCSAPSIGATGTIEIDGQPARKINSPRQAKSAAVGMALIPEDRKNEGLMLPMSVRANLSFAAVERFTRFGVVDQQAEHVGDRRDRSSCCRSSPTASTVRRSALSGGNQQKVVIGKWLMNQPRIILLNDPTRGIDVGTKQEFYQLLRRLAATGAAIIYYSTDYDELIGCCDRVLVLYDGSVIRDPRGRRADRAQSHQRAPSTCRRARHRQRRARSAADRGGHDESRRTDASRAAGLRCWLLARRASAASHSPC